MGNKQKQKFCKDLGADLAIVYKEEDFFKKVQSYTKNKGVDIILDMVGKEYFK